MFLKCFSRKIQLLCLFAVSAFASGQLNIIPQPQSVVMGEGSFILNKQTRIQIPEASEITAQIFANDLKTITGLDIGYVSNGQTKENVIVLSLETKGQKCHLEGYRLEVSKDQVQINAGTSNGLFYGCQSFLHLLGSDKKVPCVTIEDHPRFGWRGLMLDCSRTFQSPEYIKKTIDRMAFYKMNILHLHLTDDQGWRLEIKKYPKLTQEGAVFADKYNEPPSREGYYSQEQMKDIIEYAKARGIIIVPEIEMPGHSIAPLSCYPELSCTGGPFEIYPYLEGIRITKDIYCAGNEQTFAFLEDVLDEVIDLFESEYIHIGGDEAPKNRWQECPKCQKRIKDEKLKDEHELQSYFIKRMENYINSKGKKLIGWDEILEGGLAPNATVMSWRGVKGGIAAAKAGHDVIMSPTSHCYFDYKYSRISSISAYSFEPIPEELNEQQANHILGLQANFWSHIDRKPELVDRQLFPRLLATAERGWSDKQVRDASDFKRRVKIHLQHLDRMGINCQDDISLTAHRRLGKWKPEEMSEDYKTMIWDVTDDIKRAGEHLVKFLYTHGEHRLDIEYAELLYNSKPVAKDAHHGQTGAIHLNNDYVLTLKEYKSGKYEIRASVRSDGGLDSNGQVYLIIPD